MALLWKFTNFLRSLPLIHAKVDQLHHYNPENRPLTTTFTTSTTLHPGAILKSIVASLSNPKFCLTSMLTKMASSRPSSRSKKSKRAVSPAAVPAAPSKRRRPITVSQFIGETLQFNFFIRFFFPFSRVWPMIWTPRQAVRRLTVLSARRVFKPMDSLSSKILISR